jgi:hypothetical protein
VIEQPIGQIEPRRSQLDLAGGAAAKKGDLIARTTGRGANLKTERQRDRGGVLEVLGRTANAKAASALTQSDDS